MCSYFGFIAVNIRRVEKKNAGRKRLGGSGQAVPNGSKEEPRTGGARDARIANLNFERRGKPRWEPAQIAGADD
jgi:hypothetical protein